MPVADGPGVRTTRARSRVVAPPAPAPESSSSDESTDHDDTNDSSSSATPSSARARSDDTENSQLSLLSTSSSVNTNGNGTSGHGLELDFKKIRDLLCPLLGRVQREPHNQTGILQDLRGEYAKCGPTEFARVLFRMMAAPWNVSGEPNPHIKKLCGFFNLVVNEIDENEAPPTVFQRTILRCCLKHWANDNKNTRERIFEVIINILRKVGKDNIGNINHDMALKLENLLVQGLKDKHHKVRALCAGSLQYFIPLVYEPGIEMIEELTFNLHDDPSHEVRRASLLSMRFGTENFDDLYKSVTDVHESVRQMAFTIIKRDNLFDSMPFLTREKIIIAGLNDFKESVVEAATSALKDFLERACENDIRKLLKRFDVFTSKNICNKILGTVIPNSTALEKYDTSFIVNGLIPYDQITDENLFFWVFLVKHYPHSIKTPNVGEMCNYILEYKKLVETNMPESYSYNNLNSLFWILELLHVEEAGRRMMEKLVYEFCGFKYIEYQNAKYLIRLLERSTPPNIEEAVGRMLQNIQDHFGKKPTPVLISPPVVPPPKSKSAQESEYELTKLKTEVGQLVFQRHKKMNDMNAASQALDFAKAQEYKVELEELASKIDLLKSQVSKLENQELENAPLNESIVEESDSDNEEEQREIPAPTQRSLQLAFSALVYYLKSTKKKPSAYTRTFMDLNFTHGVSEDDILVRQLSLEARTIFGLFDSDEAETTLSICIKALYLDPQQDVRTTAYKCIIDLLLKYGFETFGTEHVENLISGSGRQQTPLSLDTTFSLENPDSSSIPTEETTMLKSLVVSHSTSTDEGMKHTAYEGSMKLLLAKRIRSPRMISNLLMMWVNPAYATSQTVKDIKVFLPMYVRQGILEYLTVIRCIPDCVYKIVYAPPRSPFHSVIGNSCSEELIKFVAYCTGQEKLQGTFEDPRAPHDALIRVIFDGLKGFDSIEELEVYIRCLKYVNLDNTPAPRVHDLSKQYKRITRKLVPPPHLRLSLNTFKRYLERLEADGVMEGEADLNESTRSSSRTMNTGSSVTINQSQMLLLSISSSKNGHESDDENLEVDFD